METNTKHKTCDCLKTSEKNIIDFVKKDFETNGKKVSNFNDKESGYVNKVFSFGKDGGLKLVMPFEVAYTPIKANGTLGKEVKYKTSIFPTYCPFCGQKQNS
jgi:hypothetical protein